MSEPLTEWQKLIAENYGDGDFAHVAEMTQEELRTACIDDPGQFGDTLFVFLMLEPSPDEDCDGWQEAVSRINSAADQITELQVLIGDAANA